MEQNEKCNNLVTFLSQKKLDECKGSCQSEESELAACGLSHLGYAADGSKLVYLNLSLTGKELTEISFVQHYKHIQIIDISNNQLTDIDIVLTLQHLVSLNASHNHIFHVPTSSHLCHIKEANFDHNQIVEIGDLSCYKMLTTLFLSHNNISEIGGLSNCTELRNLSLSHNSIEKMSGLEKLFLRQLNLSNNNIEKIENIENLKRLQYLDLSNNKIDDLKGLRNHPILEQIYLPNNQILDISGLRYLEDLKMLRVLDFTHNPLQNEPDYRLTCLFKLPVLTELDLMPVEPEEKVMTCNLFNANKSLIASLDYSYNLMQSYGKPVQLLHSSQASGEPYPILILTGPMGIGKRDLAIQLTRELPDLFVHGKCHTTKESCAEGYYHVSREVFETQRDNGTFLETCLVHGHCYGVSTDEIERIAEQNRVCVLSLPLEGVMGFKCSHFRPRYVLILPEDNKVYGESLRQVYSEVQIATSLRKIEEYIHTHHQQPGYFDAVICSDDPTDRYKQLKNIVLDYLAMTPPLVSISSPINKPCKATSFESRCSSREKGSSRSISRDKSSIYAMSPTEKASFERRFEETRNALNGTSSFEDQLSLVSTPVYSIPHVSGHADLLVPNDANSQSDLTHNCSSSTLISEG